MSPAAAAKSSRWNAANLEHLSAAVDALADHIRTAGGTIGDLTLQRCQAIGQLMVGLQNDGYPPPALEQLRMALQLSRFEADVLLLCAAWELDACRIRELVAQRTDDTIQLTFGLAMSVLPNPHWSASVADQKLRRLGLVHAESGANLPGSPIRVSEHVLDLLKGVFSPHAKVAARTVGLDHRFELTVSERAGVDRAKKLWEGDDADAFLQFYGQRRDLLAAATVLGNERGAPARLVRVSELQRPGDEDGGFLHLLECDVRLGLLTLVVEVDATPTELELAAIRRLADLVRVGVILCCPEPVAVELDRAHAIRIGPPTIVERREAWRQMEVLDDDQLIDRLAHQYRLSPAQIEQIASQAVVRGGAEERFAALWQACREAALPDLSGLATPITKQAHLHELVLPDRHLSSLRALTAQARHRYLGDAEEAGGFTAMFAGPSGTGKTMAAGVIGRELSLPVFRIDLSSVVSKYVGETEKHLRKVFDAAEVGGVILLFDEADALFGKRTSVSSSHDRHANIEVSYLLQRLEAYTGIAILTTNNESDLDQAFARRIRSVVRFPHPTKKYRLELWRRSLSEQLDPSELDLLAELPFTGANISNVVAVAKCLARDANLQQTFDVVLWAARLEFEKVRQDEPLPAALRSAAPVV